MTLYPKKEKPMTHLKLVVIYLGVLLLLLTIIGIIPIPETSESVHDGRMERLHELQEEVELVINIENKLEVGKLIIELDSLKKEIDNDLQRLDSENRTE